MTRPHMQVASTVLSAPDPRALAAFYERLLGWPVVVSEPALPGRPAEDGWVILRGPTEASRLSFQYEEHYTRPVWPGAPGEQGMMLHLDIAVEDLEAGVAWAVENGAAPAEFQPQDGVRVMLDPAGHPFCLFAVEPS
jgi:catechol 2,3-dioxygenase-like lactoylglutathione lyase family enzyme